MAQLPLTIGINIASVPVRGFGGMCMVVASVVCAATLPETRWFMFSAVAVGAVWGTLLIAIRRAG